MRDKPAFPLDPASPMGAGFFDGQENHLREIFFHGKNTDRYGFGMKKRPADVLPVHPFRYRRKTGWKSSVPVIRKSSRSERPAGPVQGVLRNRLPHRERPAIAGTGKRPEGKTETGKGRRVLSVMGRNAGLVFRQAGLFTGGERGGHPGKKGDVRHEKP